LIEHHSQLKHVATLPCKVFGTLLDKQANGLLFLVPPLEVMLCCLCLCSWWKEPIYPEDDVFSVQCLSRTSVSDCTCPSLALDTVCID